MKKAGRLLSLFLALILVTSMFASCGKSADNSPSSTSKTVGEISDPYGKFANTITMTIGKPTNPSAQLPSGESLENNEYVNYISDKLNVKYSDTFQAADGDAYVQKVDLTIASGDLPDIMFVNELQLKALNDANLLADIGDAFNQNISPKLKAVFDSTGGTSLKRATFDGKLKAIPNVSPGADAVNVLWVRQDWLDKLKIPAPKTIEDIENIAKAFINNDPDGNGKKDTIGLAGQQNIVFIGNSVCGFDSIFSLYDGYPQLWKKDASGAVVYGSIEPQVKQGLSKLKDMYAAGLIDPEFVANKDVTEKEKIVSGKCGLFFGSWWMPMWGLGDQIKLNPAAEWRAYAAPLDNAGKFKSHNMSPTNSFMVVKKGYSNPAAVIRTLNYEYDIDMTTGADFYKGKNIPYYRTSMPLGLLMSSFTDKEDRAKAIQSVMDGKSTVDKLTPPQKIVYDFVMTDNANPKKDNNAWQRKVSYMDGAGLLNLSNVVRLNGVFYSQTPTMAQKWANLKKLEDETFIRIIIGSSPLDSFSTFVSDWKKLGGDAITKEVAGLVK